MSAFDYLNRSSRTEAERVRGLLEEWCSSYPAKARSELISRLRSRRDLDHVSAVFELALHEVLRRAGLCLTPHPEISGGRGRPDFLVTSTIGVPYYLEATLTFDATDKERGEKLLAQLYDILDKIDSPNYFIGVFSRGLPDAPLKARVIRGKLQRWLGSLDYSQCVAWATGEGNEAQLSHSESGVTLVFTAIPKHTCRPGTRAIGLQVPEARWTNFSDAIRSRLLDKVGQYGRPDAPLVIAVNVFALSVDRDEVMDALFGHIADAIDRETGATRQTRTPNGFWYGPAGIQNTRVTGVIWTSGLDAWNLADRVLEWVPNPWAAPELSELGFPLTRVRWQGNGFVVEHGPTIGQSVGLPAGWPGDHEVL
jgi:hypothetical protein